MELEGLTFAECLADAQRLGYAEADPTFDVEGFDTAHKLAILTSLAFGTEIDAEAVYVEGISTIAPLDLAWPTSSATASSCSASPSARATGHRAAGPPDDGARTSAIAQVMGVTNAVTIDADAVRELTLIGPGAGGEATASAVVADIADVASGMARAALRAPGRPARAGRARADAAPRGRLLHPPDRPRPPGRRGRRRDAHGRGATSRSRASCSTAPRAPLSAIRTAAPARRSRWCSSPTRPTEAAIRAALGQDRRRRAHRRTAPGHPHRTRMREAPQATLHRSPTTCRKASPSSPARSSSAS